MCLLFRNSSLVVCGGWAGMGWLAVGAAAIVTQLVLDKLRKCMWMSTPVCMDLQTQIYALSALHCECLSTPV